MTTPQPIQMSSCLTNNRFIEALSLVTRIADVQACIFSVDDEYENAAM